MTTLPGMLVGINEIDGYTLTTMISQLFINQVWSQEEFNELITSDPTYPDSLRLNNLRALVLLSSWSEEETSHEPFDLILFAPRNGMVEVEKNKFGPPGQTYVMDRVNIYDLLRVVGSPYVATIPNAFENDCCSSCNHYSNCGCGCNSCCCDNYPFGRGKGIVRIEYRANDTSGVHQMNCDSEPFNRNFKSRKS